MRYIQCHPTGERERDEVILEQVGHMAGVVAEICRKTGCSIVLDIGSGLVLLNLTFCHFVEKIFFNC